MSEHWVDLDWTPPEAKDVKHYLVIDPSDRNVIESIARSLYEQIDGSRDYDTRFPHVRRQWRDIARTALLAASSSPGSSRTSAEGADRG